VFFYDRSPEETNRRNIPQHVTGAEKLLLLRSTGSLLEPRYLLMAENR
jgi:hypothetical protein